MLNVNVVSKQRFSGQSYTYIPSAIKIDIVAVYTKHFGSNMYILGSKYTKCR